MQSKSKRQIQKVIINTMRVVLILSLCFGINGSPVTHAQQAQATPGERASLATSRHGGWLDEIDFSAVSGSPVSALQAGTIDVYGGGLGSSLLPSIRAAGLKYATIIGIYYSLLYNPAACTDANKLNPFKDRAIREATNRLYDRSYIKQSIYSGGGQMKWFAIQTDGPDYADLLDTAQSLEASYSFYEAGAIASIAARMTVLGATKNSGGKWVYHGSLVALTFLIRSDGDGSRALLGDYAATQLEKAGFTVTRQFGASSQLSPFWQGSDPKDCSWNIYTAGWMDNGIVRDARESFREMYLPNSPQDLQVFKANVPDVVFQQVGDDLANANFTTGEQRHTLMTQALALSLQDSLQVFLVDTIGYAPYHDDIQIAANIAIGIQYAPISFYTARFKGLEGGTLKWGESNLLSGCWNPVAGGNVVWEMGPKAATSGAAFMEDPLTGLKWPLRAASASLTVQSGLPVFKTLDWITLTTASSIDVPADAWVDWDASTQLFIPAGTGTTAKIKSVITYPADLFDTVTWHDGSPLSVADFIMSMIMTFDRAKPGSEIYDASAVNSFNNFKAAFKGVRIVSTSPLVIETYSDNYFLDAELNISSWWPNYGKDLGYVGANEAPWPAIAIANQAEAAHLLSYSGSNSIEYTSFVGGSSLAILSGYLDAAITAKTIPYAPTMSAYLSADGAAARYSALKAFYTTHGHFWVGSGPYYLDSVNVAGKSLVLKNYALFPDHADRWSAFYVYQPSLTINYSTGAPGSYFTISGADYPPDHTASISVNGNPLGTAQTDATGAFIFILQTNPTTDEGYYRLTVSVDPAPDPAPAFASAAAAGVESVASTQFTLEAEEVVRPQEGVETPLVVPDGIALQLVYLPLVMR